MLKIISQSFINLYYLFLIRKVLETCQSRDSISEKISRVVRTLETAFKERHKLCHTRYVLAKPIVVPIIMCFFGIFYPAYWVSYYSQSLFLINQNVMTISFILWIMQNLLVFHSCKGCIEISWLKGKIDFDGVINAQVCGDIRGSLGLRRACQYCSPVEIAKHK